MSIRSIESAFFSRFSNFDLANQGELMLTIKDSKAKLIKFLITLSILVFFIAFVSEIIMQSKKSEFANTQNITIEWLQSNISNLDNEDLKRIWNNVAKKLASYDTYFQTPSSVSQTQSLVSPMNFFKNNDNNSNTQSIWHLDPNAPPVEVNFNYGLVINSANFSPTEDEINSDKARYTAVIRNLISDFKNVHEGPLMKMTPEQHSESMLDFFNIKDVAKKHLPNLSVGWIYMASTSGTFAMYPGNSQTLESYDISTRDWYKSPMLGSPKSEQVITNKDINLETFGLVPSYYDFVTKGSTRTLWHKISIKDAGSEVTYMICVDFILDTEKAMVVKDFIDRIPPYSDINRFGLLRALKIAIISSLFFATLGFLLVIMFGKSASRLFIAKRRLHETQESGDKIKPVFQAYAAQDKSTREFQRSNYASTSTTTKVSFLSLIPMNVFKLQIEKGKISDRREVVIQSEKIELGSLDNDMHTRGLEKWHIYRHQSLHSGSCRLCGQDIRFQDKEVKIGEATIKHRTISKPEVNLSIEADRDRINPKDLKERIIWTSLGLKPTKVGGDYELGEFFEPRIPTQLLKFNFVSRLIDNFQLINEGRHEVSDCTDVSKEIFKDHNVKAVCRIEYFVKAIQRGGDTLAAFQTGENIERTFIADTKEELEGFADQYKTQLLDLLKTSNQQLYTLSFDRMKVESIGDFPEMDFALAYGDFTMLIVANTNDLTSSDNVRGYVSWRNVDVLFFETLLEKLTGTRRPLEKEDLLKE